MPYLLALFLCLAYQTTQAQFALESRLATGQWCKIGITQTGIYKIDASFLQNAGFDVNTLNPQHLHVHGYGGGMLPQANATPRLDDLPENAVFVQGEQDGRFDAGDYILFYGESSDKWSYNANAQLFEHETNLYADTTYYFICLENRPASRLAIQAETVGANFDVTQYEEFVHYEKDETNYLKSGREWYGEPLGTQNDYTFNFSLPDIMANSPIRITSAVMARDSRITNVEVYANDELIGTQAIDAVNTDPFGYDYRGRNAINTYTKNSNGNAQVAVKLRYKQNGGYGNGFINYLTINYRRALGYPNGFFRFRSLASATGLFDIFDLKWHTKSLQLIGIEENKFSKANLCRRI
ncbi:MAG: hypothetical protein EAZ95_08380 [Bacteroidetes bacterium]|nr:MAG: hypothetical protein EAZ95_08380 [Bacteroidota bacterium]